MPNCSHLLPGLVKDSETYNTGGEGQNFPVFNTKRAKNDCKLINFPAVHETLHEANCHPDHVL